MSPAIAEDIAILVAALREHEQDVSDEVSERVDAWIERELYPESALRQLYRRRVVFHHAQLPPRIRSGLEEAIREKKVDVVCATTTLAEGVNFPFSTVVVQSLIGKSYQISPRALWNIAGRAGRFGVDSEGHFILLHPETWASQLKGYSLSDYLKSSLSDIPPPVKSALASGLERLETLVEEGRVELSALVKISLADITVDGKAGREAKSIRGFINLMRVGDAHADSTKTISFDDETTPEFEAVCSHPDKLVKKPEHLC
jgi:superfamily II DNA/RNA helicase